MFSAYTHKPTQYPGTFRADVSVDEMTPGTVEVAPVAGRTVRLHGWVSTYNIYQMLQLLAVGDAVSTDRPTAGKNLMSIALWDEFCHHLIVYAFAGEVRVQRIS